MSYHMSCTMSGSFLPLARAISINLAVVNAALGVPAEHDQREDQQMPDEELLQGEMIEDECGDHAERSDRGRGISPAIVFGKIGQRGPQYRKSCRDEKQEHHGRRKSGSCLVSDLGGGRVSGGEPRKFRRC